MIRIILWLDYLYNRKPQPANRGFMPPSLYERACVSDSVAKQPASADSSVNGVSWTQRMRPMLGTLCVIEASAPSEVLQQALASGFGELTRVAQLMHPTREGSDLPRLATRTEQLLQVDAMTWEVLTLAWRFYELSQGCFDPCLPSAEGRLSDVELLADNKIICHRPVAIDLGGIAKGYAVDRAVAALRNAGCESGMVNAGGDLRVFGARQQHILLALAATERTALVVHDKALAVSDAVAVNHPPEHQGYYLRNGHAPLLHQQAAVLASTAAVADALTKCALLCDETTLQTLLRHFDAELVSLR
jgi:thiamine biosynthesis lipoprotein